MIKMIIVHNDSKELMESIGQLNQSFFPGQIIAALLALIFVCLCFFRQGIKSSNLMKLLLALLHGINGFGTLMCFFRIGEIFYAFESVFEFIITILFVLDIFLKKMEFKIPARKDLKYLSFLLIIYGIFVYPLIELILGYTWPNMAVFGALCPTSIFSIGIIITALPEAYNSKEYKLLLALLSIGGIIIATRAVIIGLIFDSAYLISGICGLTYLIKYKFYKNDIDNFHEKNVNY